MVLAILRNKIKLHGGALKSVSALAGGNLLGAVLGAVGGILVARFIDPEVNGQFRVFTLPLLYLTFLHLGTFDGLYRQIPFFIGKEQKDHAEQLASSAGAWNLGVTMVVATGFLVCTLIALWQGNPLDAMGWFSQIFCCVGVYYSGYLGATYRTLNNFVALARINLIQAACAFLMVLPVALWGFYGLCLRAAAPAALGAWLLHRARPIRIPLKFNLGRFKEIISIGLPLCAWGTAYTSIWLAAEYSLMLYYAGLKGAGLFAVALIMREAFCILPQAVHQVLAPRTFTSYARSGSSRGFARQLFLTTALVTPVMLVALYLVCLLLDYFVPLVIPKYIDGLLLMKISLGLAIIQAVSLPLNGLVATGRSWLYGKGILAGIIVFPVAVYFLHPVIGGMLAVAVGSLIGRGVRTIVAYFDLYQLMKQEGRN